MSMSFPAFKAIHLCSPDNDYATLMAKYSVLEKKYATQCEQLSAAYSEIIQANEQLLLQEKRQAELPKLGKEVCNVIQ